MPYRGKPIAEGGFIPSQIGTGEAQVFKPVQVPKSDLASIERAYAHREAGERAQEKATQRAKEKKEKELEWDPDVKGMVPGAVIPYMQEADKFAAWTQENIDAILSDSEKNGQWMEKRNELLGLAEVLKQGNKDIGSLEAVVLKEGEGSFENEENLTTLRGGQYYTNMQATPEWIQGFGEMIGGVQRKSIFSPLDFETSIAKEVPIEMIPGNEILNEDTGKWERLTGANRSKAIKIAKDMVDSQLKADWKAERHYREKYGDDWIKKAQEKVLDRIQWPKSAIKDISPTKAKAKTGWQHGKGYAVMGDFIFTPKTTIIAGTDAVTHPDTKIQTKEGFPWLEITEEQITDQPGTPSREVHDYSISPFKKGSSLTKKMNILNPDNPEETITVEPTRFRKDGENWFVMADWNDRNIHKKMIIPLGTISEESLAELGITVDLLEEWERQRLSGAPGSTAPRTTGGTSR